MKRRFFTVLIILILCCMMAPITAAQTLKPAAINQRSGKNVYFYPAEKEKTEHRIHSKHLLNNLPWRERWEKDEMHSVTAAYGDYANYHWPRVGNYSNGLLYTVVQGALSPLVFTIFFLPGLYMRKKLTWADVQNHKVLYFSILSGGIIWALLCVFALALGSGWKCFQQTFPVGLLGALGNYGIARRGKKKEAQQEKERDAVIKNEPVKNDFLINKPGKTQERLLQHCPHCDAPIPKGAVYCPHCSKTVKACKRDSCLSQDERK